MKKKNNVMRHILNETEYKLLELSKLPYEELSQWEVGKAVIKAAVNRWTTLGFLDGITNETKKEMLAIAFDNMAHDLLAEDEKVINLEKRYNFNCSPDEEDYKNGCIEAPFEFSVVVFPILRRVICGVVGKSDGAKSFSYKKFLDYLEDLSFLAINYDGYNKEIDVEAEFCAIISLLIEERFDNEKNDEE